MDTQHELTAEQASRIAVTAVTTDLDYWARCASVDGRVGLNELTRILGVIREASAPEPDRSDAILGSVAAFELQLQAARIARADAS
jgi:hypothetical protein